MENREDIPMLPIELQGNQQNTGLRGVLLVSVPEGGGKAAFAAFAFQNEQQQERVTTNAPQYAPAPTEVVEETVPPSERRPRRRISRKAKIIIAFAFFLGLAAFLFLRAPTLGQLEEQWDDSEEWAHVHKLYAKRLISMAPGNMSNSYDIPESGLYERDDGGRETVGLVERDYGRRKLWERVVNRGAEGNGSAISPVVGNVYPDGLYYMRLLVGTPPKPYFVDIDTGSDLTWLQCDAPCQNCAETPHPLYRHKTVVGCSQPACSLLHDGSRYGCNGEVDQCDYEIEYGDSSSTMGVLVQDEISLLLTNGTIARTDAVFGCSYDQQGSLAESPAKTDGLIGLNRAKLGLPAQLSDAGIVENVFAHCLAGGNRGGGYLFFGDDLVPSWGMTWTPLVKKHDDDSYFVSVSKVKYGRSTLDDGDEYDFIFDSGTSYTYLVPEVYTAFIEAVQKGLEGHQLVRDLDDKTLPYCWKGKTRFRSVTEASHYFQPVTLNFKGSWLLAGSPQMVIIPQSYLIITPEGNVCMGIMDSSDAGNEEINIIGDISLRGHLVVYDNVQNRVGWMPSDCRKPPKARTWTAV